MKERDKFLMEALNLNPKIYWNFSTWEGFGKLWEWAQKQEWWSGFKYGLKIEISCLFPVAVAIDSFEKYINPDRFADALYDFLRAKK